MKIKYEFFSTYIFAASYSLVNKAWRESVIWTRRETTHTCYNNSCKAALMSDRIQLTVTPLSFHSRASKSASSTISRCWPYSVRALVDLVGLQATHSSHSRSTQHTYVSFVQMPTSQWVSEDVALVIDVHTRNSHCLLMTGYHSQCEGPQHPLC